MLPLPLWLPTRKFVYLFNKYQLFVYNFSCFSQCFPQRIDACQNHFSKHGIPVSSYSCDLRRWMWTLWFVRSCHQGSSGMRHLLFRWKGRLYGNLRKGQGCLHLLWSPINHSFLKIENKTVWRKENFCATNFLYKTGNLKSSMKINLFVQIVNSL